MVEQWCDNEQAVKDSNTPLKDTSMMIKVEADIILAIHHLCNRFPFHTNIQHIYGHQDTRKPKRHNYQDETSRTVETDTPTNNPRPNPPDRTKPIPKPVQYPKQTPLHKGALPIKVQINITCNRTSTETTRIAMGTTTSPIQQTILTPPYEGLRAMLWIRKTWITAHYKKSIYDAHQTSALSTYMKNKYSWSKDTINTINWASINSVRCNLPDTKKCKHVK